MGLPGDSQETIKETIEFAKEVNPHTLQVSLAAPYPGTFLYERALDEGWLNDANADLVNKDGLQIAPLSYPGLTHTEIFVSVEIFYRRFYFRPSKIAAIVREMTLSPEMMRRRLREGAEFSASCASAERSRTETSCRHAGRFRPRRRGQPGCGGLRA